MDSGYRSSCSFQKYQIGLSVLASVPGSKTVYPLLGRPHDSLNNSEHKGDAG